MDDQERNLRADHLQIGDVHYFVAEPKNQMACNEQFFKPCRSRRSVIEALLELRQHDLPYKGLALASVRPSFMNGADKKRAIQQVWGNRLPEKMRLSYEMLGFELNLNEEKVKDAFGVKSDSPEWYMAYDLESNKLIIKGASVIHSALRCKGVHYELASVKDEESGREINFV